MTIRAILAGKLFRPAEAKTANNGKSYVTASIALDGQPEGQPRFLRATAFGDDAQALLALDRGAAVALAGRLECSIWTPEGKAPEIALRLVADSVLILAPERSRPQERPRQPAQEARHEAREEWEV